MAYQNPRAGDPPRCPGQLNEAAARSASFGSRVRSEDSWVELSSQPSSSSLSSIGDEIVTTGLRVQHDRRQQQQKRRRTLRPSAPSGLNISTTTRPSSSEGGISSQEEYEESESESDRVMTSSGEGGPLIDATPATEQAQQESSDDEDKTAINHPLRHNLNDTCFTPQPNAFTHPPSSGHIRNASHPPHTTDSYFPASQTRSASRPQTRQQSYPQHLPQNILSPSYNAAAQHEEALRASLSTLLSCAAAARGLPAKNNRTQQPEPPTRTQPRGGNRVEPMSFRLVPESALPVSSQQPQQQNCRQQGFQEPTFHPTLRRTSTSTTNSAPLSPRHKESKRKTRPSSKEDRGRHPSPTSAAVSKKARRSSSASADPVSPTLLTWVVSAGVVVVLSALSFSAGYSMGREAGRWEVVEFRGGGVPGGGGCGDEVLRGCAREAGRSGLGLKRSLARSAVQV